MISKTLAQLYTPKFNTKARLSSDGLPLTTVIDKLTGEPVEVAVKPMVYNNVMEQYNFLRKKKNGHYEEIGCRMFDVNRPNKKIQPGYMESSGNNRFSGIGFRMHQIAIERMMELGFDNVEIFASYDALPFHYKSGFKAVASDELSFNDEGLKRHIQYYANEYKIDVDIIEKFFMKNVKKVPSRDSYTFDFNKYKEDLFNYCMEHKIKLPLGSVLDMELTYPAKRLWEERIRRQPILLGIDYPKPNPNKKGFEFLL